MIISGVGMIRTILVAEKQVFWYKNEWCRIQSKGSERIGGGICVVCSCL